MKKYELFINEKEEENRQLHDARKHFEAAPYKNKKSQSLAAFPEPDPRMPPFEKVEGGPFGDDSTKRAESKQVTDQLKEFVSSPLEFRAALLNRFSP